jgi:hypothetical protein
VVNDVSAAADDDDDDDDDARILDTHDKKFNIQQTQSNYEYNTSANKPEEEEEEEEVECEERERKKEGRGGKILARRFFDCWMSYSSTSPPVQYMRYRGDNEVQYSTVLQYSTLQFGSSCETKRRREKETTDGSFGGYCTSYYCSTVLL